MLIGRHGTEGADAWPKPLHHHITAGNWEGAIKSRELRQQGDARLTLMLDVSAFRLLQPGQSAQ